MARKVKLANYSYHMAQEKRPFRAREKLVFTRSFLTHLVDMRGRLSWLGEGLTALRARNVALGQVENLQLLQAESGQAVGHVLLNNLLLVDGHLQLKSLCRRKRGMDVSLISSIENARRNVPLLHDQGPRRA